VTDERLRDLYGRVLARRGAERDSCATPEALLAIVDGTADEPERLRVLRHVGACRHCRAELDLLRTAEEAGRGTRLPRVPAFAVAASVMLLAAAVLVWRGTRGPVGDGLRAPPPGGGVHLLLPPEDATMAGQARFVWAAVPGASRYRVELLDAGGQLVFHGESRDTTLVVPGNVPVVGNAEYLWWVWAEVPGGAQVRSTARRVRFQTP
jgi:hypothetical protein